MILKYIYTGWLLQFDINKPTNGTRFADAMAMQWNTFENYRDVVDNDYRLQ